jgi:hypothetical protein
MKETEKSLRHRTVCKDKYFKSEILLDQKKKCIINGEPGEVKLLWPTFQRPLPVHRSALFARTVEQMEEEG